MQHRYWDVYKRQIYAYSNKYLFFFLQYIDKSYQYAFIPKTIIIFFPLGFHESYLSNLHFFIRRKIIQIVFLSLIHIYKNPLNLPSAKSKVSAKCSIGINTAMLWDCLLYTSSLYMKVNHWLIRSLRFISIILWAVQSVLRFFVISSQNGSG